MKGKPNPNGLDDLVLVGRRASVVLVAPDPVPDTGDDAGCDEDHGGVVDQVSGDGDGCGHAEKRHSQKRPSCGRVSGILSRVGDTKIHQSK